MPPKTKKPPNPKGKYIIYSNHSRPPLEIDVMNYVSFDPGRRNFDIRFECRGTNYITTREHAKYVIPMQRKKSGTGTISETITTIVDMLDHYSYLLKDTHIALVEDQMCANDDMMMIYTCVITYFVCKYPQMFVAAPVARLKCDALGMPKNKDYDLKAWGEGMAMRLARERKDNVFIGFIDAQKAEIQRLKDTGAKAADIKVKVDDSTDNLIQIEAFCVQVGYKTTKQIMKK